MRASLLARRRDRRHPVTVLLAGLAIVGVVVGGGIAASPASAKEKYPTYADVVKARKSTAATQALIKKIESALAGLEANAKQTAEASRQAGDDAQAADQKYQVQVLKSDELQSQADAAKKDSEAATAQAAAMVSRLYRSGSGGDMSLQLLLDSEHADDVLYGYSLATKLTEQTQALYEDAKQKQNTAQSLSDQAGVAQRLLKQYKDDADAAYAKAAEASTAAADALNAEQAHKADLLVLERIAQKKENITLSEYNKGVKERQKERDQGGGSSPGEIKNGWTNPEVGPITSPFGWRTLNGSSTYHLGTDIGAACGTPEYAAHEATVSYAGWNGVYGNFIRLDVGGGIQLEYGHIIDGGILVKVGQAVGAGQEISRVGKTGGATGCHLHFGVRINGVVTDPVPFMKARGVTLGVG